MFLEKFDFERRMAIEREIDKAWDTSIEDSNNVCPGLGFDESQSLIYYGSPLGIKVVNVNNG